MDRHETRIRHRWAALESGKLTHLCMLKILVEECEAAHARIDKLERRELD